MAKGNTTYIARTSSTPINVGQSVQVSNAPAATHMAADDYLIVLINMTNDTSVMARYGTGNWFVIPTTPHNCGTDCDSCFDNRQWQEIVNVSCNEGSFQLTVATQPDNNGNARGAIFDITPNCSVSGGAICVG